jgi:hypothetical protein
MDFRSLLPYIQKQTARWSHGGEGTPCVVLGTRWMTEGGAGGNEITCSGNGTRGPPRFQGWRERHGDRADEATQRIMV